MYKHEQEIVDELKSLRDTRVYKYSGGVEDYLLCDNSKKIIDNAISLIINLTDEINAMEGIREDMKNQLCEQDSIIQDMKDELYHSHSCD